jgi:hypothetical protein
MIKKIAIAAVLTVPLIYFIATNPLPSASTPVEPAMQSAIVADVPSHEPAATNDTDTEIVLGIPVRKDRHCRVELKDYVTTDGEMFSAYSCTPDEPAAAHIYAEYDNETLANMVYADAIAAALLGRRLIGSDTGRSYELLVRASALESGNVEHLAWLSDQAFGAIAIDGKPQLGNLQRQYELAALARRLGDSPGKAEYLRNQLLRYGIDETKLDALNKRADELLESMRDIQRTVQGETSLGGQDDA